MLLGHVIRRFKDHNQELDSLSMKTRWKKGI
jgi:hypothetical protein